MRMWEVGICSGWSYRRWDQVNHLTNISKRFSKSQYIRLKMGFFQSLGFQVQIRREELGAGLPIFSPSLRQKTRLETWWNGTGWRSLLSSSLWRLEIRQHIEQKLEGPPTFPLLTPKMPSFLHWSLDLYNMIRSLEEWSKPHQLHHLLQCGFQLNYSTESCPKP